MANTMENTVGKSVGSLVRNASIIRVYEMKRRSYVSSMLWSEQELAWEKIWATEAIVAWHTYFCFYWFWLAQFPRQERRERV